jgi:hypothetical protein
MSELLILLGIVSMASVPAYVGFSMIGSRVQVVDIAGWGYSLILPAIFLGALLSTWFDAFIGASVGTAVTIATLVPTLIFHRVRRTRFFIFGVSPNQLEAIQRVVSDSTGRVGRIRRDSHPPQFGNAGDFVIGPPERLSGSVWLGFGEALSVPALRALRNKVSREIPATAQGRAVVVAVGFVLTGALCFALFWSYFGVDPI